MRLFTPGQFLLVGCALLVPGVVLLGTDEADIWMGLLVLALGAVTAAGAIASRRSSLATPRAAGTRQLALAAPIGATDTPQHGRSPRRAGQPAARGEPLRAFVGPTPTVAGGADRREADPPPVAGGANCRGSDATPSRTTSGAASTPTVAGGAD